MKTILLFGCLAFSLAFITLTTISAQEKTSAFVSDGYVATSEQHGTVEIRCMNHVDHDGLVVEVTYKPTGGTESNYVSEKIVFKKPVAHVPVQFKSVVDKKTGNWVVYDTADLKFVFIAIPPTKKSFRKGAFKNYWHPGVHVGWARGIWIDRYRQVRETHKTLPYEHFVGEQFVIGGSGSK